MSLIARHLISGISNYCTKMHLPSQRAQYLQPLAEGSIRSCFSMTEPDNAGSNPTALNTSAIRKGNEYVINGNKWFTTGADGANFAIVMAVTDTNAGVYERASMIIVPTATKGFNLVRNIPIMGEPGEGWLSHGEIEYSDCKVSVTNLVGKEGAGFTLAQERLGPGRIHHCMRWIGICERAFLLMCEYAKSRDMGDGQKLSDKQTCAKLDSLNQGPKSMRPDIWFCILLIKSTKKELKQPGHDISAIKFFVADVLMKVLRQVHSNTRSIGDNRRYIAQFLVST
jgi:alkylation response protein AidB-like acyl-CoA dehydrogenase